MYRNLTDALIGSLKLLLTEGSKVPSRNGHTLELYAHQMKLERPWERVLITPGRENNPFASLAETMWVIGGRDDMEYLSRYLPRATDFSDDGKTWRGAYGPRLRAWPRDEKFAAYSTTNPDPLHFADQLEECVKVLCEDLASRRAVMMIFDPARDFVQSKDIPCNNWIHWLVREGKLNMTVGVRSNDAIWGFSGINLYEWSVLQQMMAHWVGVEPGVIAYTASSFHLYDHHFERAEKVVAQAKSKTLYDFGFTSPKFTTGWEDFRPAMDEFYALEKRMWENALTPEAVFGAELDQDISKVQDDFLRTALQMLRIYQAYTMGANAENLALLLSAMPSCDLKVAAIEYLSKQKKQRITPGGLSPLTMEMVEIPSLKEQGFLQMVVKPGSPERAFFDFYHAPPVRDLPIETLVEVLKTLHAKKTRSYGTSWKKHGEVLGVFSNITRKRDRIIALRGGAKGTSDEGIFDTVADLGVYAAKYLTLLSELFPEAFNEAFKEHTPTLFQGTPPRGVSSDGTEGFDAVLDDVKTSILYIESLLKEGPPPENLTDKQLSHWDQDKEVFRLLVKMGELDLWEVLESSYKKLEAVLTRPDRGGEKGETVIPAARLMCTLCLRLLQQLTRENPTNWARFAASVEAL